jgi:DnaJ-domain-containing protein 1
MLQEETREADRARREEEYAHYEKLSNIELPPEVMAELKKKVRKPQKAKVEAEPVLA